MFVQVGAWRSIEELEESLILNELFLLVRACNHAFSQQLKAMAVTQGAEDIDLNEDWYDTRQVQQRQKVLQMYDLPNFAATGLSLGYESNTSQNT